MGHKNTSVLATILQEVEEQTGADVADEHLVAKDVCVTAFEGAAETVSFRCYVGHLREPDTVN